MNVDRRILVALQQIYDMALQPDGADDALSVVVRAAGADRAVLTKHDSSRRGPNEVVTGFGYDADMLARFESFDARALPPIIANLPLRLARRRSDLFSVKSLLRSPVYNDVVRPNGDTRHALMVNLARAGTQICHFHVDRLAPARDFSGADAMTMSALVLHWLSARKARQRLHESALASAYAGAALNSLNTAVMLVDRNMRVVFLNAHAESLIAADDGLQMRDRRLMVRSVLDSRSLQQAVSAASKVYSGNETIEAALVPMQMRIPGSRSGSAWRIDIVPIRPEYLVDRCGRDVVALFVSDCSGGDRIDAGRLRRSYRLSQREAEVALLIAQGQSIKRVATALSLTHGTARWYLQRVLEKTNTHRQAELVGLISHARRLSASAMDHPLTKMHDVPYRR